MGKDMAGKLLNSCYFYVVLAHIPAGGLCTNQGASAAPPRVVWGCQVIYNPSVSAFAPWEGWKLQQLLGTGI